MAAVNGQYTLETKRQAVAYFNENKVPKHVETLLNQMFKEKPEDIYGYMSEYFGKIAKTPTISKLTSSEVLSSRGYPSADVGVHCTINGLTKCVNSAVLPVDGCPPPVSKVKTPDPKGKSPEPPKQSKTPADTQTSSVHSGLDVQAGLDVDNLVDRITETISPRLTGIDPVNQNAVDEILKGLLKEEAACTISRPISVHEEEESESADKPADDMSGKRSSQSKKSIPGKKQSVVADKKLAKESTIQMVPDMEEEHVLRDYAVLGVSMATVMAGATLSNCSVYEHLARIYSKEPQDEFTMPLPVMPLLTSGKAASGKQNLIKEILIVPRPGEPTYRGLQQLTEVYHQMGVVLQQKLGTSARCVTDDGSYSPVLDKPETAIEYVQDAVVGCGYTLGTDLHMILNIAASEFYDQEKFKYEIMANAFKSSDDLVNLYCEFMEKYPGILAIIDGVRSQDKEGWLKLNQRIGETCFIIGSELYRRNPSLLGSGVTDKLSSVALLCMDHANTVTELLEKAASVTAQDGLLMMSEGIGEDVNTLLVDLAIAAGARYIRLGCPARMEHVTKYRRMRDIEQSLEQNGKLVQQKPHEFPVVNVPEEELGDDEATEAEEIR